MKKISNLNEIKEVRNLEELSQYDSSFRKYMKEVVKCQDTAEDLVNDMYIKMHTVFERGKVVNGGYIFLVLKSIHLNHLKAYTNRYDFGDSKIPEMADDIDEVMEFEYEEELKYKELDKRLKKLSWYEKKVLELEGTMSLRELANKSKISYRSILTTKDKIKDKLGINNNKN